MDSKRQRHRILVDIPVTVTTVLEAIDARIVDLSEQGAQIVGTTLPRGAKFQIDYMGQTIFAHCMWSEVDRMGARFPFDLVEGPLYDRMMAPLSSHLARPGAPRGSSSSSPAGVGISAARLSRTIPFGRRTPN